jgi:putative membrane protein
MIVSVFFAFIHFIAAFGVAFSLVYEYVHFKQSLTVTQAKRLQKVDSIYGLSALIVLVAGFVRVFYFEKGSDFYFSSDLFYLKLGLFSAIGLLSIYPTIRFMKWSNRLKNNEPIVLSDQEYMKVARILKFEVLLLILLVLSASLMAKGSSFSL